MEVSELKVVLEVFIKEFVHKRSVFKEGHPKPKELLNLCENIDGIDSENLYAGIEKIRRDFEKENIHEDNTKKLIFNALLIIFRHTTLHQRFHELQIILEYFYNKIVENSLELKEEAAILTVEKYKEIVRKLLPYVKVTLFIQEHTFKERVNELYEIILNPVILREDCYEIVRNKFDTEKIEFLNYEVAPVKEKSGYLGDYFRLRICIIIKNERLECFMFIKCLPLFSDETRISLATNSFQKEQLFYLKFIPHLKNLGFHGVTDFLPKCYFSSHNLMVFEDLSSDNYINLDMRVCLEYSQISSIYQQVSKLNAAGILFEEKLSKLLGSEVRLNQTYDNMLFESFANYNKHTSGIFNAGIETIFHICEKYPHLFKNISIVDFKRKISSIGADFYEQVKPSKSNRNFLVHGDFWIGNILFKRFTTDCLLIDYQFLRYCTPTLDIQILLYLHSNRETWETHGPELLNEYYKFLKLNLAKYEVDIDKIYNYETFQKSLEETKPTAIVVALLYLQMMQMPMEKAKYIYEDSALSERMMAGDRYTFVEQFWEYMETYRFKDLLEELLICIDKSK